MPAVSIRPNKANFEYLETLANRNSFFQQIIELVRTGQLPVMITNTESETLVTISEQQKDPLEVQKVIVSINRQNQSIEESKARTRYLRLQCDYLETFKKPMGLSAARMLKPVTREVSVNQTLSCPMCNEHFRYSDRVTLNAQKDAMVDHYHQRHGAMPQAMIDDLGTVKA